MVISSLSKASYLVEGFAATGGTGGAVPDPSASTPQVLESTSCFGSTVGSAVGSTFGIGPVYEQLRSADWILFSALLLRFLPPADTLNPQPTRSPRAAFLALVSSPHPSACIPTAAASLAVPLRTSGRRPPPWHVVPFPPTSWGLGLVSTRGAGPRPSLRTTLAVGPASRMMATSPFIEAHRCNCEGSP